MFWLAWDRVVNSTANRWAYIAISGKRTIEDDSFENNIISFVQEVYPKILTKDLYSKFMHPNKIQHFKLISMHFKDIFYE